MLKSQRSAEFEHQNQKPLSRLTSDMCHYPENGHPEIIILSQKYMANSTTILAVKALEKLRVMRKKTLLEQSVIT